VREIKAHRESPENWPKVAIIVLNWKWWRRYYSEAFEKF